MRCLKFMLFGLVATAASVQAAGAASLVGKKSKTKDYNYSWETREYFVEDCSHNANKWICKCVLDKLQHEYSEAEFLYINEELYNNIDHPEFVDFISTAVDQCDAEYTKSSKENKQNNEKFSKDIDKVLKDIDGLQTTGKTVLGGKRSKLNDNYIEDYTENKSSGTGDGLAGLLGGSGGGIATKAKGSIRMPSESEIDMSAGRGSRSIADIMKVVRQRTPGLRHVYNKYLKIKPNFQGKVSLKLTIAPGGEIISISIASSTTGYKNFDNEIKDSVSRWKFSKVKNGNATVTIPFTFSE